MKKRIIVIISAFVLILIGLYFFVTNNYISKYGNRIVFVAIGSSKVSAELVVDGKKMERGLGMRNNICSSCGMLFKFQKVGRYTFWMKDMRFPLDIIWILNNSIVYVEKNVKHDFAGFLVPSENADAVLELNAGYLDKNNLKVGDIVTF
ncbi:MAG: DUF192 domain-containing protein [bacterium]